MPKLIHRNPKYRKHESGQKAVVTIGGRDIYLGEHAQQRRLADMGAKIKSVRCVTCMVTTPAFMGDIACCASSLPFATDKKGERHVVILVRAAPRHWID
jgi:hypothetical protein